MVLCQRLYDIYENLRIRNRDKTQKTMKDKNLNNPLGFRSISDRGDFSGKKPYRGDSGFRGDDSGSYVDPHIFFNRPDVKELINNLTNYDFYNNLCKLTEK